MRLSAFIVLFVVTLVILGYLALVRAPDMLANNLAKKLGVSVSIDAISLLPTKVNISKFEIGNPRGYSLPKAFSAQESSLDAPLFHYIKEDSVIDEVDLNDIYLGLEFDSTSSVQGNWSRILSHLEKSAGLDKDTQKRVTIKKMVFTNIHTELLFRGEGNKVTKLPTIQKIELNNISTHGGWPTDQIMGSILGQMVKEVFIRQNMQNALKGLILDPPESTLDNFLKQFDGLLNILEREEIYITCLKNREFWQGGALNLNQALPAPKQLNLNKLSDAGGIKFSGCPTQLKTDFSDRLCINLNA